MTLQLLCSSCLVSELCSACRVWKVVNVETGECTSFTGSDQGEIDAMVFSEFGNSCHLHGVMPVAQHPQYPDWSTPQVQPTTEENNEELTRLINESDPAALPRSGKQRFSGQMHFLLKPERTFQEFVLALSTRPTKPRVKRRKALSEEVIEGARR